MKYLVAIAFLAILASLGSALYFMMKDGQDGKPKTSNMARALAFRVGFSILLFVFALPSCPSFIMKYSAEPRLATMARKASTTRYFMPSIIGAGPRPC